MKVIISLILLTAIQAGEKFKVSLVSSEIPNNCLQCA